MSVFNWEQKQKNESSKAFARRKVIKEETGVVNWIREVKIGGVWETQGYIRVKSGLVIYIPNLFTISSK